MKTNSAQPKKKQDDTMSKVAPAAGAGVAGAGLGVAAAAFMTSDANAGENEELPTAEELGIDTPVEQHHSTPQQHHTPAQQHEYTMEDMIGEGDGSIEVLSYETHSDEDGNLVDLAVLSTNGHEIALADIDMDGEANYMMSDMNQNGYIEDEEVIDITNEHISMQPIQEAYMGNNYDGGEMASSGGYDPAADSSYGIADEGPDYASGDYINNANVDDYLA